MSEWREVRFSDVIDLNPSVKLERGIIYPFIGIADINESNFYVNEIQTKKFTGQSGSKFHSGDTLFSRITPCLENRKIAQSFLKTKDRGFGSTELLVFRAKEGKTEPNYVNYLAQTDIIVLPAINSMSGASGRQRADSNYIKKLKISVPDFNTQKKISKVLSIYDKLIENNNRRIEVLEQIAEEIYKEWFVRMRFPGSENTKFDKGIPEGWEVKRVENLGEVVTGKTPSTKVAEYYGEEVMFIKTPDMHGNIFTSQTESYLSEAGSNSQANKLLPQDSIMVSCIGTGGVVSINMFPAHTNQQINSIIFEDIKIREWAFFTLKSMKKTIELFGATGATMTNLSKGKFEGLKLLYPSDELLNKFNNITKPMFEELKSIILANENLKKQRDLLLPRLMNGTIEVK
ncbi:restriction endonuclease subunit S [Listeria welshimeri]|uniref:restriction endonuclease subunit S n=1 Tax=Listeria welshimeri TaxID=1643 RepID=UPI001889225B|nr:restriction endonuclease subunit S [Listeria welshimeri]MBF2468043.1 restriction endonuclease subunit S [Listeria welshimeri]MBF2593631.1 restriction endonuclease subunit S [Listeria welshimeri]